MHESCNLLSCLLFQHAHKLLLRETREWKLSYRVPELACALGWTRAFQFSVERRRLHRFRRLRNSCAYKYIDWRFHNSKHLVRHAFTWAACFCTAVTRLTMYQGNFPLPEICTLAYLVNLPVYTHAIGSADLNTVKRSVGRYATRTTVCSFIQCCVTERGLSFVNSYSRFGM